MDQKPHIKDRGEVPQTSLFPMTLSLNKYEKTDRLHRILDRLACPKCRNELLWRKGHLVCDFCITAYPVINGIADLRLTSSRYKVELTDWLKHWSESNQKKHSQKFFSFYRKTVFARTVRYFVNHFFPSNGVFLEAGSGTSETSARIDKYGGQRTLVAVDIVFSILDCCHPIMDVKLCGDIFCLPFLDESVDGIWNVGVMEHFTRNHIDQIMREFHRVLRYGGSLILLWPGTDSIPQKLLHFAEKVVTRKEHQGNFRFHPPEISQLSSIRECHDVLHRNRFKPLHIDFGFRSLMAFKTLIGVKNDETQHCYSSKK
jgi:SAM-dependent methyltransferase